MSEEALGYQEQPSFLKRYWFVIAVVVLAAAILGVYGYNSWKASQIPVMKKLNDFTLEKVDNTPFRFNDANGKVRLVSFIFTRCPDVCPPTTKNMQNLQEALKEKGLFGKDAVLLTVSFDTEHDTADVLRGYAEKFSYDPNGWYFLRGSEADIQKVTKDFGVGVLKQEDTYLHTMRTFLVDKDGNMRKAYGMAAEMDLDQIVSDIQTLAR